MFGRLPTYTHSMPPPDPRADRHHGIWRRPHFRAGRIFQAGPTMFDHLLPWVFVDATVGFIIFLKVASEEDRKFLFPGATGFAIFLLLQYLLLD
jgi:hypothetical protein